MRRLAWTSLRSTASGIPRAETCGECGTNLAAWPSAKHFTSWLALAPHNKISEGKVLSSKTRRTSNRAASLPRLAAGTVGRTDTAPGAFYRRLPARMGKAKAITATARKIAVLFYNTPRHGVSYADPGASYYEHRYKQRVLTNLQRRAKSLGFVPHQIDQEAAQAVVFQRPSGIIPSPCLAFLP
jgi:transposase